MLVSGPLEVAASIENQKGIDTTEIIDTVHARRPPMLPASTGLN